MAANGRKRTLRWTYLPLRTRAASAAIAWDTGLAINHTIPNQRLAATLYPLLVPYAR